MEFEFVRSGPDHINTSNPINEAAFSANLLVGEWLRRPVDRRISVERARTAPNFAGPPPPKMVASIHTALNEACSRSPEGRRCLVLRCLNIGIVSQCAENRRNIVPKIPTKRHVS
ncbi:uncharacterized protein VTP21DRAFT_10092 [Calcarisporiella thermophila]|uniref:uncharacterized protein n=1 Tax=Calcarisporiella thermophila TaxID=911321 RepID=UPI0037431CBE